LRADRTAAPRTPAAARHAAPPVATIDRDELLAGLFHERVPAREDVLRAVRDWLDDAEGLANMR
jgi:hypothetical protein